MSVTIFGSCRIDGINNNNNLNNLINYTHSTKEVLQQIKFLLGDLSFPSPYNRLCFRTGIVENKAIIYDNKFNTLFKESSICVIEICSDKKYMYNDFFLHHLCVDKRFPGHNRNTPREVLENFKCIKQTSIEIENDILEIKKLLEPRKIIVVTHYNSKMKGKYIESRNNLIRVLIYICERHNIPIIQPSEALTHYNQEDVMGRDLGHYTPLGSSKFIEYINKYIEPKS